MSVLEAMTCVVALYGFYSCGNLIVRTKFFGVWLPAIIIATLDALILFSYITDGGGGLPWK